MMKHIAIVATIHDCNIQIKTFKNSTSLDLFLQILYGNQLRLEYVYLATIK